MKSTPEQLTNRGYLGDGVFEKFRSLPDDRIAALLRSKAAVERTAGAVLIGDKRLSAMLPQLCETLKTEMKLYTKIALCEAIAKFGTDALEFLIPLLGEIGNNRHKKAEIVDINKKSYPLPRDIAARIIIRIGPAALPSLEKILQTGSRGQILEALDAVGHIAYTSGDRRSEKVLMELHHKFKDDELIRWKIIRAFQSFGCIEVISILEEYRSGNDPVLRKEAGRSLERIINKGKTR